MRFSHFGKRVLFAAFDGGEITSDAGVLLRCEQARRIRLFERMADCFSDRRDPTRTVHGPGESRPMNATEIAAALTAR